MELHKSFFCLNCNAFVDEEPKDQSQILDHFPEKKLSKKDS